MVALRGLSLTEGVDYEESYATGTLQDYYPTFFSDIDYILWMYRLPSLMD